MCYCCRRRTQAHGSCPSCIAYPSGEMKHGPIALLEKDSPVIVTAPDDAHRDKTLSNLQECRARGARIIPIHEEGMTRPRRSGMYRSLCPARWTRASPTVPRCSCSRTAQVSRSVVTSTVLEPRQVGHGRVMSLARVARSSRRRSTNRQRRWWRCRAWGVAGSWA